MTLLFVYTSIINMKFIVQFKKTKTYFALFWFLIDTFLGSALIYDGVVNEEHLFNTSLFIGVLVFLIGAVCFLLFLKGDDRRI